MKVNDYVRTKNGNIRKIKEVIDKAYIDDPDYYVDKVLINIEQNRTEDTIYMEGWLFEEEIIKSSPNIIDLIEVGDYVNGKKVVDKQYHYTDKDNYDMGEWCIFYENVALGDYQYDIKSIVTKEQLKDIEYEVE